MEIIDQKQTKEDEEIKIKQELIFSLACLRKLGSGVEFSKNFTINDSLEELENELEQIKSFLDVQKILDTVFDGNFDNFLKEKNIYVERIEAVKELLRGNMDNLTSYQMNFLLNYNNNTPYNGPLGKITSTIEPQNSNGAWKVRVNSGFNLNFSSLLEYENTFKFRNLPQIIGGTTVDFNELPFMVSLGTITDGSYFHFCGGTIISPYWIMTAAHCVRDSGDPTQLVVRSSLINLNSPQGDVNNVIAGYYNPNWDENNIENGYDIGLLRLSKPIKGTPVKLAQNDDILIAGYQFLCAGWGSTEPNPVDPVASTLLLQVSLPFLEVYNGNILLLDGNSNSNICFGDSGGPCLAQINGQWVQYGITSFTVSNCTGISGWTKITSVMNFIKSYVSFDFYDSGWQNSGDIVNVPAVTQINYNIIPETLDSSQWNTPDIITNVNVLPESEKSFTFTYTPIS